MSQPSDDGRAMVADARRRKRRPPMPGGVPGGGMGDMVF
jgi:hypothetical protein